MKKMIISLAMMFAFSTIASPSFAFGILSADGGKYHSGAVFKHEQASFFNGWLKNLFGGEKGKKHKKHHFKHDKQNHSVPEIDTAGTALAASLLGGLLLISRERRRNR